MLPLLRAKFRKGSKNYHVNMMLECNSELHLVRFGLQIHNTRIHRVVACLQKVE